MTPGELRVVIEMARASGAETVRPAILEWLATQVD